MLPRPNFVSCRYCATCELNWPYIQDYTRCPKCDMATSVKSVKSETVLTTSEAKRLVKHIEFDKYIDEESDAARRIRQSRAKCSEREEWHRDDAYQERMQRFTDVIAGAGFTKAEKELLRAIERALPPVSNPRYADPLAD